MAEQKIQFEKHASAPLSAVAIVFDLEGFSRFFSQPDVHTYVPAYLNEVLAAVYVCLTSGKKTWGSVEKDYSQLSAKIVHTKFLGDGAMFILTPLDGASDFKEDTLTVLCNRLWNLKKNFKSIVENCSHKVPVVEVPRRIRFGVARGPVLELKTVGSERVEYIGYCINLASRLQSYCRDFGFIASARLEIPPKLMQESGYKIVVAKNLKGFPKEYVIVDAKEYQALDPKEREYLFEEKGK